MSSQHLRAAETRPATKLDARIIKRLQAQWECDPAIPFLCIAAAARPAPHTRVFYDGVWAYEWTCDCRLCGAGGTRAATKTTDKCEGVKSYSVKGRRLLDYGRRPMTINLLRSTYFPSAVPVRGADDRDAKTRAADKRARQQSRGLARQTKGLW
jgi:hypothetical protein